MNTSPAPLVGILDRLSIGVSRTSIRHYAAPRIKKKKYHLTGFRPAHGERIFVYNHIENGMIIYSHEAELKRDSQKHLSQIPFTAKKQKPAALRHDYWQPLCMIQFGAGQGEIGRNVFQKLREFRQLHELQWGWQAEELRKMNKRARGEKIHDQKPNAVADIAAVLAGAGRGNLMWELEPPQPLAIENGVTAVAQLPEPVKGEEGKVVEEEGVAAAKPTSAVAADPAQASAATAPSTTETKSTDAQAETKGEETSVSKEADETAVAKAPQAGKKKAQPPPPPARRLIQATIYWANDVDLEWARKWSENVIHEVGLPDGVRVWNWKTKMIRDEQYDAPELKEAEDDKGGAPAVEANTAEAGSAGEGGEDREGKEGEESKEKTVPEQDAQEQKKKNWLGWLGGKSGGSPQDARA